MAAIETHDHVGGVYLEDNPAGVYGSRLSRDRRYWLAWERTGRTMPGDCEPGVMDDFGLLVQVPWPDRQTQH